MQRRRKKSRLPLILALAGSLAVLVIAVLVLFLVGRPYSKVIIKAGQPMIEASTFFKNGGKATFVVNKVDVKKPGEYTVKLKKGLFTYKSLVVITDEEAPVVDYYSEMEVSCGDSIKPESLIKSIQEESYYTVSWVHSVSTDTMGYTTAEVSVKDAAGNETTFITKLHVIDANVVFNHKLELGDTLTDSDFFVDGNAKNEMFTLTPSLESFDFSSLGIHEFTMEIHGDCYKVYVNIVDTVAPTASAVENRVKLNSTIPADRFVTNIYDKSEVTVSYAEEPDFSKEGAITVKVKLTDAAGNSSICEATANVLKDTVAPVISGEIERNIYIGEDMSLLSGIVGMDDFDGEVVVYVDRTQVNAEVVGDYEVTYWAEDESGNKSEVAGLIHVYANRSDDEKFHQLVSELAAKIFKDGMTDKEKARAIYDWGHGHIGYTGKSNVPTRDNWRLEAIYAFEKRSGDCYTDYSFAKAMFEYCGIPTLDVTRAHPKEDELNEYLDHVCRRSSAHYWLLVNVGEGWYQFDAGLRQVKFDGFLFTKAAGDEYSEIVKDYYYFDVSLYPDIEIQ